MAFIFWAKPKTCLIYEPVGHTQGQRRGGARMLVLATERKTKQKTQTYKMLTDWTNQYTFLIVSLQIVCVHQTIPLVI